MVNHPGTSNGSRDVNSLRSKKGKRKHLECGENICGCKKWPSDINWGSKYMYIVITNPRHSKEGAVIINTPSLTSFCSLIFLVPPFDRKQQKVRE